MKTLRPLLLVLAGCAVYLNSLEVPFVFDDLHAIVRNLRIRELWPGPFLSDRPIVELTLAANYAIGGLAPFGYHLVNLALHLACGLLVFDLGRRTLVLAGSAPGREEAIAWWAALLFLVHPIQTESVTYVISRSELLVALWYLLTLELFVLGETHRAQRGLYWAAAVASCALGMATKPVMVTAPLAVPWLARCLLSWPERARITFAAERGPARPLPPSRWPLYGALAATWAVLGYLVVTRPTPGAGLDVGITPLEYLRTQLGVTWHYFRLLVWPVGQTIDYDWPLAPRWSAPAVWLPALGWLALAALLGWLYVSGRRAAAFWLGLALLVLLPSSSVVPIVDLVFEHRMYLSVAGFAMVVALATARLLAPLPWLAALLGVAVALALASTTVQRNQAWRDPVTLWEDALAKAPAKIRVYRGLESAYQERGDEAGMARVASAEIVALERRRATHAADADVLTALGNAYARVGRIGPARVALEEAVARAPRDAVARAALGSFLLQLGRPEEAVVQLEMALALADGAGAGWIDRDVVRMIRSNLGWAYASVGRADDALRILRHAAASDDVAALNNLGSILGRLGHWGEARTVLERALQREPDDPNVLANLGWVYANVGELREASAALEAAILRQPREPSAHGNLGWVRLRAGNASGAMHALAMAQTLQPESAWLARLRGIAHARLEEWEAARRALARAQTLAPHDESIAAALARVRRGEQPELPGTSP